MIKEIVYEKLYCKVKGKTCLGVTLKTQNRERFFKEVMGNVFWMLGKVLLQKTLLELSFEKWPSFGHGDMRLSRGQCSKWKD